MTVLLRYLPRHLADHLLTRGAVMVVVGIVFLLPFLLGAEGVPRGAASRRMLEQSLGNVAPFLTLIATYGIVGADIRHGYYRFLFSKPLRPVAYYGLAFGVALTGFLVATTVLIGVFAVVLTPVWPAGDAFGDWVLQFLLLGALVFVFSRFTRLDWVLALFVLILGEVARGRWPAEESVLGTVLNVLLPPRGPPTYFPDGSPAWGDIGWTAGYAALMVALGLLAVRYVPPGEGR